MAGVTTKSRHTRDTAERRRKDARRKLYVRRRFTVLALLLALIVGAYFGIDWILSRWLDKAGDSQGNPDSAAVQLAFTPDILMPVDFDGDTKPDAQIAVGPTKNTVRQIAMVTGTKAPLTQIGEIFEVPAFRLEVRDLPRAKGVLVLDGHLPTTGEPKKVEVPGGGTATEAAGGEPAYRAWRMDKTKGLVSDDYYALAAPVSPTADIVVDKWLNTLWLFKDGQLAATYRVATGRFLDGPAPAAVNQAQNYVTPLGKFTITNLQVNPPYNKTGIKGGDPNNPLGTRFLGYSVYNGDSANVWAIHGTNEELQIGKWVSDGCIRLKNRDVEKLYEQVRSGMTLEVVSSKP
ncbi:MAG TPA: L,D-transpeptidase [Symbiobacteriaceae bacterium]|nr:L,D-transpeptidase [Symbiobacteriaceae bacterium]